MDNRRKLAVKLCECKDYGFYWIIMQSAHPAGPAETEQMLVKGALEAKLKHINDFSRTPTATTQKCLHPNIQSQHALEADSPPC